MITPQIVDYIKNTVKQGYPEEKIQEALVKKGWSQSDVTEAFRIARGVPRTQAVPPTTAPAQQKATANGMSQQPIIAPQSTISQQTAKEGSKPPAQPYRPQPPQLPQQRPSADMVQKPTGSQGQPTTFPSSAAASQTQAGLTPTTGLTQSASPQPVAAHPVVSTPVQPMQPQTLQKPAQLLEQATQQTPGGISRLQPTYPSVSAKPPSISSNLPDTKFSARTPGQNTAQLSQPARPAAGVEPAASPMPGLQKSSMQIPVTTQPLRPVSQPLSATEAANETTSTSKAAVAPSEQKKSKKIWLYGLAGAVIILGVYVFAGIKFGIYAFGYNLFPFEGLVQKVGKTIGLTSPTPTPLPSPITKETPSPKPAQTQTQTPSTTQGQQVNGRSVTVFGTDAEAGTLADLSYSQDRKKMAYITLSDTPNLFIMDILDESKENIIRSGKVSFPPNITPVLIALAPDSVQIAVVAKNANNIANIYVINTVTKTTTRLTQADTLDVAASTDPNLKPQWNKDATAVLAYVGNDLWRISASGGERARITAGLPIGSFRWSQDNTHIVYTIRRATEERVWIMDADGKNYKSLTPSGISQLPQFSASGLKVYYINRDPAQKQDVLWSIGADGSNPEQVTSVNGTIREFAVDAQGRTLFVVRGENGRNSLWMAHENGVDIEEAFPAGEYEPMGFAAWNADATKIFSAGLRHFLIQLSLRPDEFPKPAPSPSVVTP